MDSIQLNQQYQQARKDNKEEFESFTVNLKNQIAQYQLKSQKYQHDCENLKKNYNVIIDKQKEFESKYETFDSKFNEIKQMDVQGINQILLDEEKVLNIRRQDITLKMIENNQEFDKINERKIKIMNDAENVMNDENVLKQGEDQLKQFYNSVKIFENQLIEKNNFFKGLPDQSTEKITMHKQLLDMQQQLNDQVVSFRLAEEQYKRKMQMHNDDRKDLHSKMKFIDQEIYHGQEIQELINEQIKDLNIQIQSLNDKKQNLCSSADYIYQTSQEIEKLKCEITQQIESYHTEQNALNVIRQQLMFEQEIINSQIKNSQLKLKYHQQKDDTIVQETQQKLKNIIQQNDQKKQKI